MNPIINAVRSMSRLFVFGCLALAGVMTASATRVEYIQGGGYLTRIVTDFTPNPQTDKIVAEFALTQKDTTQTIWCARGSSATTSTWSLFLHVGSLVNSLRFDYNSSMDGYFGSSAVVGTKYKVTAENNALTWDGGDGYTHTKDTSFTEAGGPLTLFASYKGGTDNGKDNWGTHKLYSFKIYRNGTLIHDLVPMDDGSGNGTLVDLCANPLTITREGTFTCGKRVPYRVTPDAAGGGDGQSWASAMTITEAITAATANDEIWCKAGTYPVTATIAISKALMIRGGYAGDDSDDAALAEDGGLSVFDAYENSGFDKIFNITTAGSALNTFERIEVTRSYNWGIYKTGKASIVLQDCRITRNGRNGNYTKGGRGLHLEGDSSVEAIVKNCVFAENQYTNTTNNKNLDDTYGGWAGYFYAFKRVTIDGATVVSNGLSKTRTNGQSCGQDRFYAAGFHLVNAPLTLVNSAFRANVTGINGTLGGIVRIEGNGDNNVISNCLFAGNAMQKVHDAGNSTSTGAAVMFSQDAFTRKSEIVNCTFVYNLTDGIWTPADVSVTKGDVKIRNSIFWGAFSGSNLKSGKNVHVSDGAKADIDYCLFESKDATCVSAITSTDLTLGDHIVVGDPCFVTARSAIASYARSYKHSDNGYYYGFDTDHLNDIMAIDAHVTNASDAYSRAIDTGDGSPYANEPNPNGGRINLGYYGNTADAATSSGGTPAFEKGYPTVTFTSDTRAIVTVKLASGTVCNACVTIDVTVDGGKAVEHYSISGVQSGETVTFETKSLNAVGASVSAHVVVSAAGLASDLTADPAGTATGTPPAWAGHGGGSSVVHVRAGADGRQDGSDWHNAFASMFDAMLYLSSHSEKTEMWIAGTVVSTVASVARAIPSATFAFRGGFTGVEDAASERAAGAKSTLDGNNSYASLEFSNANPVSLERLVVTRTGISGIKKTGGAGDVTVTDCDFVSNTPYEQSGCGCSFKGTSAATVSITNCLFANNWDRKNQGSSNGRAIYAETIKRLFIDDSLFVTNGSRISLEARGSQDGKNGCMGGVLYAYNAPVTARNCTFRANRSPIRGATGGVFWFEGSSAPSAFTNCTIVGSQNTYGESDIYMTDRNYTPNGGVFVLKLANATDVLEFERCTVAYSVTDGYKVPGAVAVVKGTLKAHNSIFYKNVPGQMSAYQNEIYLHADGYADLSYTRFTDATTSLGAADATHYTTANLTYGDPYFVTPTATFESLIKTAITSGYSYQWLDYSAAGCQTQLALDAHLLSPKGYWKNDGTYSEDATTCSDAIDAGDPASAYALEPSPNGACVNLGAYANTAHASKTSVVTPVVKTATLDFPDDCSQPRIIVEMSADSAEDVYAATVTIVCYTGAVANAGVAFTNRYTGVGNGVTITNMVPWCYTAGVSAHAVVTVECSGVTPIVVTRDTTVTGTVSPSLGHGGGATVAHVRPGATGLKDGSDWFNAYTDLASASLDGKTEIWIAGSDAVAVPSVLTLPTAIVAIRGGFTGTEDDVSARPAAARASFDAAGARATAFYLSNAGAVEIERCDFANGNERGLYKTGNGAITLVDCRFRNNGEPSQNISGRGAYLSGSSAQSAIVSNCVFEGNVMMPGGMTEAGSGLGLYVTGFKSLTLDHTLFATNGAAPAANMGSSSPGRDGFNGSALYVNGVPTTARFCQFRGNRATTRESGRGGCACLSGACGGSTFENCLWAGNYENCGWNSKKDGEGSGALVINLASAADEVTVKGCTVAYNLAAQRTAAAGITVRKGILNLKDSIVYGNMCLSDRSVGCDLACSTGEGSANVTYTLFTSNDYHYVSGTALTLGDGIIYADPLFVTAPETANDLVSSWAFETMAFDKTRLDEVLDFDLHLKSKAGYNLNDGTTVAKGVVTESSPSIDVGDATSVYDLEPSPNGGRVNQGAYGNTAEASRSDVGQPEIGSIVSTCVGGYTRPQVVVTLTAESPDVSYKASVEIVIVTNGETFASTVVAGVVNGGTATFSPPKYLAEGGTFDVRVTVNANGAETLTQTDKDIETTGKLPPWYGHGGPANVIHVRSGADGQGTGLDWTDAYADLALAFAALSEDRNEIWIAGTNEFVNVFATVKPAVALTVRGGFTGCEDAPADRMPGRKSVLDYTKTINGPEISSAKSVTVERLVFTRAANNSALVKSGSGNFTIRDCDFVRNSVDTSGDISGRGLRVVGTAGVTEAVVSNCVFAGNGMFDVGERYGGAGLGAYFANLKSVTLDDCLFATNCAGTQKTQDCNWGGDKTLGSAIYATSAPILARRCRFAGNIGATRDNTQNSGGTVRLCGAGGGSRFENCVFAGNFDRCGWTGQPGNHGGALVVEFSSAAETLALENCTIAYNLTDGLTGSGGILIIAGAVTAHNTIIFGNQMNKHMVKNGCGADVHVRDGSFTADYCLFTDTTTNSVNKADAATLAVDWSTCRTGDPFLGTANADYLNHLAYNGDYRYLNGSYAYFAGLNLHLRSRAGYRDEATDKIVCFRGNPSPAIDAGDPESDWSCEPEVNGLGANGKRVNLGAYGNTPYATMTPIKGAFLRLR